MTFSSKSSNEQFIVLGRVRHISKILTHLKNYLLINTRIIAKGIPLSELLVLKYPYKLRDAKKPPMLSVDLTDACNLECRYCNNPLFIHPRTMMSDDTFAALLQQIELAKVNRVRIGGGEPTLHPQCTNYLKEVVKRSRFVSIVTNAQWSDHNIAEGLIDAGIDLIEVSVDAGGAEVYEKSRVNANYQRLLNNLLYLKSLRDKKRCKTIIKIRLMIRPSTKFLEREEREFYKAYCDTVLPQLVVKHPDSDYMDDVFLQHHVALHNIPVCSVPYKDLQIRADGRIPICPSKGSALQKENQFFLGNICSDSILSLWNGDTMKEIRKAHRTRIGDILEICRDCHYG